MSPFLRSAVLATALIGSMLVFVACDSGGAMEETDEMEEPEETTVINGTATSESSSKASAASVQTKSGVEGATVTAVRLEDDGSRTELEGEAETNADGSFELEIEQQSPGATIVVETEKSSSDFSSSVGVQVTSEEQVDAQPMTAERNAEAQVAVEASAETGEERSAAEALAEATALVDNDVASAILSGETDPSGIASVATSMEETREAYAQNTESSVDLSAVGEAKVDAYERLQDALATASDEADRAEALEAFEEGVSSAYTEGGASTEEQAEIELAGTQVALEAAPSLSDEAALGLERRASVLRALSTGASVEQSFEANGSGESAANVDSAGTELTETIRSASSVMEIREATSAYRDSVKASLADGFAVTNGTVEEAFDNLQSALGTLDEALSTAVSTTGDVDADAEAVASAFENFYENGAQTVRDVYENRGVPSAAAEASTEVMVQAAAF